MFQLNLILSYIKALLPRDDTFYYCELFEIPKNLTVKHHIYKVRKIFFFNWILWKTLYYIKYESKYEVLFAKRNLQRYHHFLVYECMGNYNGEPAIEPTNCFTNVPRSQFCMSYTQTYTHRFTFIFTCIYLDSVLIIRII